MTVSSIVAFSDNNVIGIDNELPWHLPNDLKFFKRTTSNHTIIMGRKTFESIGRPLPNRENIVITRNPEFKADGIRCFDSLLMAIEYCESKAKDEVFFIGGAQIYKECIPLTDKLYITRVHTKIENGTAFFPELDWTKWTLLEKEPQEKDEKNAFDHTFEIYERSE